MKSGILLAPFASVFFVPAAQAQSTPEATLSRFVELSNSGKLATPEGQAILTGEAKEMATGVKSNLPVADKIVTIAQDKVVARFVLHGPNGEEADAYFYLDRTPRGWAVSAYRAMAMTGMMEMILADLRQRPSLSPEEQLQKLHLQLTLSPDSQLRTWFAAHRAELDTMARAANGPPLTTLTALGLQSYDNSGGDIRIIIGGMLDNTVGFLKASASGPPAISPSEVIWLEALDGGWFLFRTT